MMIYTDYMQTKPNVCVREISSDMGVFLATVCKVLCEELGQREFSSRGIHNILNTEQEK